MVLRKSANTSKLKFLEDYIERIGVLIQWKYISYHITPSENAPTPEMHHSIDQEITDLFTHVYEHQKTDQTMQTHEGLLEELDRREEILDPRLNQKIFALNSLNDLSSLFSLIREQQLHDYMLLIRIFETFTISLVMKSASCT